MEHPVVSEDKDMRYVDVILPLPLDGTFTYSIPAGMEEKVVPGMRVLVPLGKSKKYIAMVADVHSGTHLPAPHRVPTWV